MPAIKVSEYLTRHLATCGRAQTEVARICGYANSNIVTMFKNGKTKLPIAKVRVMAAALGVDPMRLLRLVLLEYEPEAWEVVSACLGRD